MKINKAYTDILLLLPLVIGLQCTTSHNLTSQKAMYKSIYLDQFKLTYFRKLLIKGFNNSEAIQTIIQFDRSGFAEPILTVEDLQLIDSLTTIDNLKMQMDSTNSIGRVAKGAEGKHPFAYMLNRCNGKWLDSLASKRYKLSGVKKNWTE
jgi:hypothetical protein